MLKLNIHFLSTVAKLVMQEGPENDEMSHMIQTQSPTITSDLLHNVW